MLGGNEMTAFDLGTYTRAVTTASPEAQAAFDVGLNWLFGFNHEAAAECFEDAIKHDPGCGMAHWGVAYAIGPNYNKVWEFFEPDEKVAVLKRAHKAIEDALALKDSLQPVEAAMIDALADRFPQDPEIEDYGPWNDAFSDAMRKVYAQFPDDLDVTSVFAEALMNRTPWALWDLETGKTAEGASTDEARTALETAFTRSEAWDHPGLLHLYIHLMEMSPWPEKALSHGDRLVDLVPDSGHLVHMATHIDVLCGDYQNVVWRNARAAEVDKKYTAVAGAQNFYTVYRIHNKHFESYGAMFMGNREVALRAAEELQELLPDDVVRYLPELFESFHGKKPHVMVRFGMWDEIVAEPMPTDPELYLYTTCAWHQAKATALANLGRLDEARAEREKAVQTRLKIPEEHCVFNNTSLDVLAVGEAMMDGEIAYKSGDVEAGLAHLRRSIELDDNLLYDEPWGWMQPVRHALGALLMDAGQYEEAEAVYRADLGLDETLSRPCQHPKNVWSLHGLHECLVRRGEDAEAKHIKLQLDQATARATVPIRASCFCRSKQAA